MFSGEHWRQVREYERLSPSHVNHLKKTFGASWILASAASFWAANRTPQL
jgi:hypothetical protein